MTTQTMRGGNMAEFYAEEGTSPKTQMLVDAHPDVAKLSWRFSRVHHSVDYTGFAKNNKLRLREGVVVPEGVDNFGMVLERIDPQTERWEPMDTPWFAWEDGR